jgi:hypothetical protein
MDIDGFRPHGEHEGRSLLEGIINKNKDRLKRLVLRHKRRARAVASIRRLAFDPGEATDKVRRYEQAAIRQMSQACTELIKLRRSGMFHGEFPVASSQLPVADSQFPVSSSQLPVELNEESEAAGSASETTLHPPRSTLHDHPAAASASETTLHPPRSTLHDDCPAPLENTDIAPDGPGDQSDSRRVEQPLNILDNRQMTNNKYQMTNSTTDNGQRTTDNRSSPWSFVPGPLSCATTSPQMIEACPDTAAPRSVTDNGPRTTDNGQEPTDDGPGTKDNGQRTTDHVRGPALLAVCIAWLLASGERERISKPIPLPSERRQGDTLLTAKIANAAKRPEVDTLLTARIAKDAKRPERHTFLTAKIAKDAKQKETDTLLTAKIAKDAKRPERDTLLTAKMAKAAKGQEMNQNQTKQEMEPIARSWFLLERERSSDQARHQADGERPVSAFLAILGDLRAFGALGKSS